MRYNRINRTRNKVFYSRCIAQIDDFAVIAHVQNVGGVNVYNAREFVLYVASIGRVPMPQR